MSSRNDNTTWPQSAISSRIASGAAASAITGFILISVGLLFSSPQAEAEAFSERAGHAQSAGRDAMIERGRYLIQIGGCNDCHTAGYAESGGQTPMDEWLTGWPIGFKGPWGTTYAANLRLTVGGLTEEQWVEFARAPRRPPMPWFNLRDMTDEDLRAMYRFIRYLGPKGERAPAAAAPGERVTTPFIVFEPRVEETLSSANAAASK